MQSKPGWTALAAIALCSAFPAAAQTIVTVEAERMTLSSTYIIENASRIRLTSSSVTGTASTAFSGPDGTYNMTVFVVPESDGQSTVQVYKGATLVRTYTYPLSSAASASFTISNLALVKGETIKLVGDANPGAAARIDKIVLTQVAAAPATTTNPAPVTTTPVTTAPATTTPVTTAPATTTPTTPAPGTATPIIGGALANVSPVTLQAEAMALNSAYVVENGNRIRLTSSSATGTASKSFGGAPGTYNITVYVVPESDGQSTLELWRGTTRLRTYTYPLSSAASASFTLSGVSLATGDLIKLVGRANPGAAARVDKIVLAPVTASTPPSSPAPTPPAPTPPAPTNPAPSQPTAGTPPVLTLPSTNTQAIATFESLGVYWKPPSNPGAAGCTVQYRKSGESAWNQGLNLWYDARNSECRGSLVYLTPGTWYQVQLGLPGQQPSAQLAAKTWSESFPIARTVSVPSGSATLDITQGGTPTGYVLYTPPAGTQSTLDAANATPYNIAISAPYVIVRGFTLKGAQENAIRLLQGAHDVVIEDNDISGWGRSTTLADGTKTGMDLDNGIKARQLTGFERVIIQRNRIHNPRHGANSWAHGHPTGASAIGFRESAGGNHVFRYNEIFASEGRYFNDCIGDTSNFSSVGFPHADTDIYANRISNCMDDGIESEGGNRNVRIWGNYIDRTLTGVATTATHVGPAYVFRNVHNRSRFSDAVSSDADIAGPFSKSGSNATWGGGRRYVFHNTTLQATAPGMTYPLGASRGINGPDSGVTNTVMRNNIWHVKKASKPIDQALSTTNDFDYDLFNGSNDRVYAGAERSGILGTPIYAAGHGWSSESNGQYQLAPNSPGYDRGVRIPNFNDHYVGAAPDMGAGEAGRPAMRFGLKAAAPSGSTPDAAAPNGGAGGL